MKWTKVKPTEEGRYWIRMKATNVCSEQLPRVVHVLEEDGELWTFEPPDYDEPYLPVKDLSDDFDWSDESLVLPEAT